MDFMSGRDGGFAADHQDDPMARGKLPFSYSSSQSSSPISSPHHQYKAGTPALTSLGWDAQIHDTHGRPDTKLELMESEDDAIKRGEQSTTTTDAPEAEAEVAADHHQQQQRIEWEHMFDKVVTPSDVGKLNRLVIPKQHAEKYFPLDSTTNEKGLLLNFEDRNGKPWRFRYSYWNSSQSYVMTKGWSRFVKEKKLDAGDIVSFQRGVGHLGRERLYIDWKRRPDAVVDPLVASQLPNYSNNHHYLSFHHRRGSSSSSIMPWSPLLMRPPPPPPPNYGHVYRNTNGSYGFGNVVNPVCSGPVYYLRSGVPVQEELVSVQPQPMPMVFESVPVVHGQVAAKRLRLFGVNMECPISESSDEQCDVVLSSSTVPPHGNATIAATHEQPRQVVSSPSHSQPPHQLRLYNGTPLPVPTIDFFNKGNASMPTLDFDI
ncbi:hypothetical protein FNV43_RR25264 [Rhamnella rubrinervis]|uniref:TF-B3 domain-containing protein n=1 Tax=Rhamnella rubrinervis TaxID=2594499 RepID=A0A8K0DSU3_9ROSA|nr:hypothetical protein FNV43_RR25264 [Rhamnella rubrinervis]